MSRLCDLGLPLLIHGIFQIVWRWPIVCHKLLVFFLEQGELSRAQLQTIASLAIVQQDIGCRNRLHFVHTEEIVVALQIW